MSLILSGSDGISDIDGSESTPAIRGTDTNTGIFFPAADTIAFAEGGAEVARFNSSGNFLIKTADGRIGSDVGSVEYGTSTSNSVKFFSDNTERMRIDNSGNLLVGRTSTVDSSKLTVENNDSTAGVFYNSNASNVSTVLQARAARTTTNNTYYAITYYNEGAGADKFRVADSGNVTNTNNSYGSISDIKLKENIVDATPKLEKICQVKVRNFNIIGDAQKQIGVVAQELEQVFPSMVEESPDRDVEGNDLGTVTKQVKYSVFVPMLIKAMQEQQAMITELNAKVDAQAVRIAKLKTAMNTLIEQIKE
jgi:hypothetical protein